MHEYKCLHASARLCGVGVVPSARRGSGVSDLSHGRRAISTSRAARVNNPRIVCGGRKREILWAVHAPSVAGIVEAWSSRL